VDPCPSCAQNIRQADIGEARFILRQPRGWDGGWKILRSKLLGELGHPTIVLRVKDVTLMRKMLAIFEEANRSGKFKGKFTNLIERNLREIEKLEKSL